MKHLIALLLGMLLIVPQLQAEVTAGPEVVEVAVTGMTCKFCVYGTEKKLNKLPGVEKAEVSLDEKRARIVMQPGEHADLDAIREAIVDAGFTPGELTVQPAEGKN